MWGTSVSSPRVAAIYAQMGVAKAGPGFSYSGSPTAIPRFMDIATNGAGAGTCPSTYATYLCNAVTGYDGPTGNGSPFASNLGSCMRTTCNEQSSNCGTMPDDCGGTLNCGTCSSGQVCQSNHCVAPAPPPNPCVPLQCGAYPLMCGSQPDGCHGMTPDCGQCSGGDICDQSHTCKCVTPECVCEDKGGLWTGTRCMTCSTAACKCAAAGGTWTGHSCL
jgi:hypothetical protein